MGMVGRMRRTELSVDNCDGEAVGVKKTAQFNHWRQLDLTLSFFLGFFPSLSLPLSGSCA